MSWHYKIGESQYLTEAEKTDNANEIHNGLLNLGFTLEALCGILGNIEAESDINPGAKTGDAWGLTQFYPSSRLTTYANDKGRNWYDGDLQLNLINDEGYYTATSGDYEKQWLPTSQYPISWSEFKQLTNVRTATGAYLYNNERPHTLNLEYRYSLAQKWYEYFGGQPPRPPIRRKKLPIFMMIRPPRPF